MALATLRALKRPGRHYLSIVGELVRQTTCGKARRLSRDNATSTEHGTEHTQASHDMFHLTRHVAQRSLQATSQQRAEFCFAVCAVRFMVTQNASYHVRLSPWPPRWHQNRLLSLDSAVWEEGRCGVSGTETCLVCR